MAKIGIIGGSGLYNLEGISNVEKIEVTTPFGKPSGMLVTGKILGKDIVFIARHGEGHLILPSEINYCANIYALKTLGVRMILSASAVGSLKLEHKPTDIVLPLQFVDRTRIRRSTFFGDGIAAHIPFARPICEELAQIIAETAKNIDLPVPVKFGGTYVCMEGPQFSTKAESFIYRSWGADVIGMTNLQEAKLAREAEIAYASMALVTDYDCWHEDSESVSVEMVIKNFRKNVENAKRLIVATVERIDPEADYPAHHALEGAIMSDLSKVPNATIEKLKPIIGNYL